MVLFVQKQRQKIREFAYQFESDAYAAPDMCLLADHITGTGVVDVAYAQEPGSIYWAVRDDGELLGMTYKREEDVVAWHRHILGGANKYTFNAASALHLVDQILDKMVITITNHGYVTGDPITYVVGANNTAIGGLTDGKEYYVIAKNANEIELAATYEQSLDTTVVQITAAGTGTQSIEGISKVKSVATISENEENQTWVIVERTIQNEKYKYVEYLNDKVSMDSSLIGIVNGTSSQITGLDHLEGESVQILIGDAVYPKSNSYRRCY